MDASNLFCFQIMTISRRYRYDLPKLLKTLSICLLSPFRRIASSTYASGFGCTANYLFWRQKWSWLHSLSGYLYTMSHISSSLILLLIISFFGSKSLSQKLQFDQIPLHIPKFEDNSSSMAHHGHSQQECDGYRTVAYFVNWVSAPV